MNSIHKYIDGKTIEIFHDNPRFIQEVMDDNEYGDVFNNLVVIDLGANIGAFSFWIYDRARVIYAIEPEQKCIDLMARTKNEGGLEKLNIYSMAISGTGGKREFLPDPYGTSGGGRLDPNPFPSDKHRMVDTKTMKEFMDDEKIYYVDILKIDIEGGEQEVFKSKAFREVAERIQTIVGEYHAYDPTKDLSECGYSVLLEPGKGKFVARRT